MNFRKLKSVNFRKKEQWKMFDLEEELKKLPAKPGVYIMHGPMRSFMWEKPSV